MIESQGSDNVLKFPIAYAMRPKVVLGLVPRD